MQVGDGVSDLWIEVGEGGQGEEMGGERTRERKAGGSQGCFQVSGVEGGEALADGREG